MARRKVKNGEKNPWGQCLTRPVPNGCRRSAFWLGRKTQKFSGTNTPESSAEHALFITQPNREPSVDGRTTSTTSIINDHTFSSSNAVIHTLYYQFRVIDPEYATFLDFIRVLLPTQQQVDEVQRGIVQCPEGQLSDDDIWEAYQQHSHSTIMTVMRKAAQRINDIIVRHLFPGQPISNIPCASVANAIFPHKQMQVIFTENRDKAARVLNGQQATIVGYENTTTILSLPEGQPVFTYPVTHMDNDQHITRYPFNPAYAQTITKSQGRNIRHLIIWLDSDLIPPGTGYVGLSRVRTRSSISFLQPIRAHQLKPVQL